MKLEIQKKEKIFLYIIFAFYCGILWLTLIDRGLLISIVSQGKVLTNVREIPRLYNLIPFELFRLQYGRYGIKGIIDANVLGNIIMFIPVGIFTCIFTKNKNPYRYIYFVPLVSIVIEISQFTLATGSLDIDDIILNSIGGFVGVGIFAVIYKLSNKDVSAVKGVITSIAFLLPPYLLIFFYKLFMDINEVRLRWYDAIVVTLYYLLISLIFKEYSKKKKVIMFLFYALFFVIFFVFIINIQ